MDDGEKITQAHNFLVRVYNEIYRMHNDLNILLAETIIPMQFKDEYSYSPNYLRVKDDYTRIWLPSDLERFKENDECVYFIEQILFYEGYLATKVGRTLKEPEIWFWLIKSGNVAVCEKAKPFYDDPFADMDSFVEDDVTAHDRIYTYEYNSKENHEKWHGWFLHKKLMKINSSDELKASVIEPLFAKYEENFGI